ncbi:MAG: VWA domain-containing protein [Terriglobia bacterium]
MRESWCLLLRSCLLYAGAFLLAAGQAPEGRTVPPNQVAGPSIKVVAPSVVGDVIVTDRKGRHMGGLRSEDFRVYENDAPQNIVTFVPPAGAQPAGAGVIPPQSGSAPQAEGARDTRPPPTKPQNEAQEIANSRFITIVMDLGDLQPKSIKGAVDAAIRYVEKYVAAEDFVAMYWVDESLHLAQAFTHDKQAVVAVIRQFGHRIPRGTLTRQAYIQTKEQIDQLRTEMVGLEAASSNADVAASCFSKQNRYKCMQFVTLHQFLWSQSTLQAKAVLTALRAITLAYGEIPGRKNVVVFSEGFLHSPDAKTQMAAVIDAANRANVAFYVIDSSGLAAEYGAQSQSAEPTVNEEMYTMSLWEAAGTRSAHLDEFDWAKHLGTNIMYDDLGQVAAATGGLLMKNQNDLLAGLAAVDRDLREFYTLVYQPTNKTYDGSFRRIKVEVLKPGLRVRHRLGYWAIPPGQETLMTPAAAQLLAGVQNGSLQPAFAPQVNAALLLAPSGELAAPVRVSLPTDSVKFEKDPSKDIYRSGVTVVLVAYDTERRIVGVHQRFLNLQFDEKRWQEFRKTDSLDIVARLAIPKLESLSIEAILQFASGTVAKGFRDIPIVASDSSPRLTSLLLTNRIEPAGGPADPSDPLRGPNYELFLPAQPGFRSSDKLTVYFGILDATLDPASQRARLQLSFAILKDGKPAMALPAEQAEGAPRQNRLVVVKQFDLSRLPLGQYTLEVSAEDPVTHKLAHQTAGFVIG